MGTLVQHGGVALFILIYVYVWFTTYNQAVQTAEKLNVPDGNTNSISLSDAVDNLNTPQWDILCRLILLSVLLLILIFTVLRSIALKTRGSPYDWTALYICMSWMLEDRIDYAITAGALIAAVIIKCLVNAKAWITVHSISPPKPASSSGLSPMHYMLAMGLMLGIGYYFVYPFIFLVGLFVTVVFILQKIGHILGRIFMAGLLTPMQRPQQHDLSIQYHNAYVRSALVVSLMSLAMVTVFVYARFEMAPHLRILPESWRPSVKVYTPRRYLQQVRGIENDDEEEKDEDNPR